MDFFTGIRKSLEGPWGVVEWIVISAAIFILLVMIPVWMTPGNDFFFQLSIYDPEVIVIMALLSFMNGLLIVMQLFIRKTSKEKRSLKKGVKKGATAFGIFTTSITATLACAACYSSILAILGLGTTAFIAEYRIWIALGALLLTFGALYYSTKRVNNHCEVCHI